MNDVSNAVNINAAWNDWLSLLKNCITKIIPKYVINDSTLPPWIYNVKHTAWAKAKLSNNINHWKAFHSARNVYLLQVYQI